MLCLLVAHFHRALMWIAGTWTDDTYQSFGFLALAVLVVVGRRLPPLRPSPSRRHLISLVAVVAADVIAAPLSVNLLSAALAILALHLWAVTFRAYRGPWFWHPQLLLGFLCLPAVYWANVLFGHQLQQGVGRVAAVGLSLYGLPARVDGTLIQIGSEAIAVDGACSGVKLLTAGLVFGLLAQPRGRAHKALFWAGLIATLLSANVARVISLALVHLRLGGPPGEAAHQAIGVVAFAMACGAALLLTRGLDRRRATDRRPSPEAAR